MHAIDKRALREAAQADSVRFGKDGIIEARWGYFYTHGRSAEAHTAGFVARARRLGFTVSVEDFGDRWAPWPRDSYFWVKLRAPSRSANGQGGIVTSPAWTAIETRMQRGARR